MLNQIVLVGRLTQNPKIKKSEKNTIIHLAVTRNYKNVEGIYETDIIPIILWKGMAENTAKYCKKGDLVGIKGRLETNDEKIEVIAEKITFLSKEGVVNNE